MEHGADFDRIGRFIDGFHRFASPGALRELQAEGPLPAGLADRGAALAERFDAVLADWTEDARRARGDSVSDERIAALLNDTRHFAAELAYARTQGS
ncbi:hypothetical protein [Massilia sp. BSC265]|uniref:hypothetical protein n=1 Tax=Massilia sp. BSC265 TaxID=1549812 RepID=UPI0004E925E1|nr:hypothetical protein [Massilia sp. BSC265]KFI05615.1 hypothetical protein JN27_21320 [Massilia sp. BSC265]